MHPTAQDPVHGVAYAFTPEGENLIVDCWFEAGAQLPQHFHPIQEEHWSVVEGARGFTTAPSTAWWAPRTAPR